jgi:hypothetical protein
VAAAMKVRKLNMMKAPLSFDVSGVQSRSDAEVKSAIVQSATDILRRLAQGRVSPTPGREPQPRRGKTRSGQSLIV